MKLRARPVRKSRAAVEVSVHVKHQLYVLYVVVCNYYINMLCVLII